MDVAFLAQHNEVEELINEHFTSGDLEGLKWIREKHVTLAKSIMANPWLVRLNSTFNGRVPQRVAHLRHVASPRQYER
jgi:hypothetical protein